jgi:AraC-like DNA-binding protein
MEKYIEYQISDSIKRFVNIIWSLNSEEGNYMPKERLILPNGCFNIVILKGGVQVQTKTGQYTFADGVFFTSQMTEVSTVILEPGSQLIFIQLTAWSLSVFPNVNLNNMVDVVKQIEPMNLPFIRQLYSNNDIKIDELVVAVNNYFRQLCKLNPKPGIIERICSYLLDNSERIKVSDIANHFKMSPRSLQTKFKRATGITVAGYLKVIRFRKTLKSILENNNNNLTYNTYINGYFDQSHLNKAFQDIAKAAPSKMDTQKFVLPELE